MDTNLEVLIVVGSRIEADLIAGRLKSSGVRAHVSADDEGGMNLALQSGRVRILVSQLDAAKARRVLSDLKLENKPTKEPSRLQKMFWRILGGNLSG